MKGILANLVIWIAASAAARAGSVVNDASLGAGSVAHGGNIFTIGPSCGKQVGSNLFYSLSTLNLDKGETADFTGPSSVANVLTRVTGGASSIDGTLECDIPNANFFLINSAGVVFGPDARLNVQGSFAVTTADQLKLSDGQVFSAQTGAADSLLTTAAPMAFGFLGAHTPAAIQIAGSGSSSSSLSVDAGRSIYLVGGAVTIQQGQINSASGQIEVASIYGAGSATINSDGTLSIDSSVTEGDVAISQGSQLVVDGSSGGQIDVLAAAVTVDDSTLSANTLGSGFAGSINISGEECTLQNGGLLNASAVSSGPGGDISVHVITLTITGVTSGNALTGILSQTQGFGDSSIGGDINVDVSFLNMSGLGSRISSSSLSGGASGNITINANSAAISPGAQILAETQSASPGGAIMLTIGNLSIDGGLSGNPTGVFADTTTASTGDGGSITLSGQTLAVLGEGEISTTTNGTGSGGAIQITEQSVLLNGDNVIPFTGIGADAQSTMTNGMTQGGSIDVSASNIRILDGAGIAAKTFGPANSGDILVTGGNLFISSLPGNPAGITVSSSAASNGGAAGKITIDAQTITLVGSGEIDTSAASAPGGDIIINASDELKLESGLISAQAHGDGGSVTVNAGELIDLDHGHVTAASTAGTGGNISLDPLLVVLQDAHLQANAIVGNGGNVTISAASLLNSNDSIIDVSSVFGTPGTVVLNVPDSDVAAVLAALNTAPVVIVPLAAACSREISGDQSSFVVTGLGGLPVAPGGWLPAALTDWPDDSTLGKYP